ncbi:MAG: acetyl-CoA hydrolase/transferase C-terminal domain-containing protein, partial [Luteimonas sp.]
GKTASNIAWNYGHATIPRHLRDVYISEYGIADVRGKTDEDCVIAMSAIADARFQAGLLETAKRNRKLRADFHGDAAGRRNTPERLELALGALRRDGTLPDYPLGSDFTDVEQRLVKALGWLKANTATISTKALTIASALFSTDGNDQEALERMALASPRNIGMWLHARLLTLALARTRS